MQTSEIILPQNGSHVQRRKMFANHPKHSLASHFDLVWMQSMQALSPLQSSRQRKQNLQKSLVNQYNAKVEERMRRQLNMDGSTYKIIPGPPGQFIPYSKLRHQRSQSMNNYYQFTPSKSRFKSSSRIQPYNFANDSLNQQVDQYNNSKTINYDNSLHSPTMSQRTKKQEQMLRNYLDGPMRAQDKDQSARLPKKMDDKLEQYLRSDQKYFMKHPSLSKIY